MGKQPLKDVFTPRLGIFDDYPEDDLRIITSVNSTLAGIFQRILMRYYGADEQILVMAVNEERFLFRLTHRFQSAAEPNQDGPERRQVQKFLDDFKLFIDKKDIFIGTNEMDYPLISYRPEELAEALRAFVRYFDLPDSENYHRAITAAICWGVNKNKRADLH